MTFKEFINAFDDWIDLAARYFRVLAKFVLSLLALFLASGLVFAIYKFAMNIWDKTPKWLKWFM
jgi:hypothetical protein